MTQYSYDDRGRLLSIYRDLDGDELTMVFYSYDALGRMSTKTFGHYDDYIFGTQSFDYDIHGWPTGISASYNGNDLFSETLRYASPQKPGTTSRYDGNISEITYTSYNGTPTPSSDTYGYAYDGLGRLTDAVHYAGTATTQSLQKTEKNITYDRDGNITGLNRYGAAGLSGMLSFTHAGNRLSSVQSWDGENLPQIGTFTYDALGNQLTDSRKGLQFCYNFANLPSKVEGMAGSANAGLTLSYGYLSDGTKTASIAGTGSSAEGLKYRGAFVYELKDGAERLSSVAWSDGRTEYDYSADASSPDISDQWHISDHLGNVRAVVLMDYSGGTVLEQNEYLPFGTRLDGALALPENRYRLAGKEEQRFGGLDLALSDFGARFYDPFTARWTTRDPLAGKYHSWSPYNYCAGNPVFYIDPTGMEFTKEAWEYVDRLITEIDKRQKCNAKMIARLQTKMASNELSANRITRLQKRVQKLNNNTADLEKVRNEISVLSASEQVYDIRRDNSLNINGDVPGTGEYRNGAWFNKNNGRFEILLGDESLGSLAHELKHAYQFETGSFSSGRYRNGTPFYDRTDELEAYQRGALFNGPNIKNLPDIYNCLQDGPMDANKLSPLLLNSPANLQKLANTTKSVFRINGVTYIYH